MEQCIEGIGTLEDMKKVWYASCVQIYGDNRYEYHDSNPYI